MKRSRMIAVALVAVSMTVAGAAAPPGESPAVGTDRITQAQIESGLLSRDEIRAAGMRMFTTKFNLLDGYGDGVLNPANTRLPGGRPTLQGNGTFLRVNGLDAQGCIGCHSVVRASEVPPVFGIGGVGGSAANAIAVPSLIDVADGDLDGDASFDGRFINPPFIFGAGGVEALGLEMTADLQANKAEAVGSPFTEVSLVTKGIDFGTIVADGLGNVNTDDVSGVADDLVVRPFGRKGEFATPREFDIGAMMFHFGMQPVEAVGPGDDDGDGVVDEILVGELSALSVFIATMDRPIAGPLYAPQAAGFAAFQDIGCADCHRPELETNSPLLSLRFPEVAADPTANVYYTVDLTDAPANFAAAAGGGVRVPLFSDLKRHVMGPELAENLSLPGGVPNDQYVTARLWGINDTAPYLHDGRATTLTEAIAWHGGEAEAARDGFLALDDLTKQQLLLFLRGLRTPEKPIRDLLDDRDDDSDSDSDSSDGERGFGRSPTARDFSGGRRVR